MVEQKLKELLSEELQEWSKKPRDQIVAELLCSRGYERGMGDSWHQFEVMLVENTPDYIHVLICVDDGSHEWARTPITSGFIVYQDGRVEV